MAAILVYIGQTVMITVVNKNKTTQGIGVVISKEIAKERACYEIMGLDGKIYESIFSHHLSTIYQQKKNSKPIVHGIACTFKFAPGALPKAYLSSNKKKILEHLNDVWAQLHSGKLLCETFTAPEPKALQQAVTE